MKQSFDIESDSEKMIAGINNNISKNYIKISPVRLQRAKMYIVVMIAMISKHGRPRRPWGGIDI